MCAVIYRASAGEPDADTLQSFYVLTTGVLLVILALTIRPRSFTHLPMAPGRVVAIIPAFCEDTAALHQTIAALLNSSRVPDEVHVVDDGSRPHAVRFGDPRVFWHRQPNTGKREAQALVLRELLWEQRRGRRRADFILTVDSDSVVDRHAVAELLRAMSRRRVQAATGLPLVRNRSASVWTRIIDLEMVTACLTLRAARSKLGVVAPCSGALSLYRADLVLDNLDDYVTSGTVGDDRRLTHYALQRGEAVAVDDAVVYTDMPATVRALYQQRVRWYRSYWRYALWELAHLRRGPALWRAYAMVMTVVTPIALAWVLVVAPLAGHGLVWQGWVYWLGLTWAAGLRYVGHRPGLSWWPRLWVWACLTPLLMAVQVVVIRPAMWQALAQVRQLGWVTRGAAAPEVRPHLRRNVS
ncbi:glycosyltransferase family 2 protein [Nonomuraea polychroma]|uniref:glycosyltransferase family 2 protein n=1 Tax=Nonomuraea polychroma TaxID=46176 RepID=UPI003D8F8C73